MARFLIGFVALALFSAPALAERGDSAWYGEVRGGSVFAMDSEEDLLGLDTTISVDTGWMVEVNTGYAHHSGWRGELAFNFRKNDFDEIEIDGFGSADLDGDIWATTAMVNGYYDISLERLGLDGQLWSRLTPFIGGGIGVGYFEADSGLGHEGDVAMTYQGLTGMSYALSEQWDTTFTYSYMSALDTEFDGVDFEYKTHNVMAGLRFRFY